MKKQVLMIALAAVALFTACQQNKGEQAASKSETKTTWTKIEPQDIENPIHLFAERHVAIATGKGDSVNAMTDLWKTEKNSSKYLDYMAKSCKFALKKVAKSCEIVSKNIAKSCNYA